MALRWWMKIPAKLVLARLPISNSFFRKLFIFRHGFMDDAGYAFGVAEKHYDNAKPWLPENFTTLELGPGDSLLSALNMHAFGAAKTYLVDSGKFASDDVRVYASAYEKLYEQGYDVSAARNDAGSVEDFFQNIDLEYLEFDNTMKELYRILRPGAVGTHVIDLKDHFEESLNNLRLSHSLWESDFFAKSGFYTNRMRHDEVIESIKGAGFEIVSQTNKTWDELPLDKKKFTTPYNTYSDENLKIFEIDIVLRKAA